VAEGEEDGGDKEGEDEGLSVGVEGVDGAQRCVETEGETGDGEADFHDLSFVPK